MSEIKDQYDGTLWAPWGEICPMPLSELPVVSWKSLVLLDL